MNFRLFLSLVIFNLLLISEAYTYSIAFTWNVPVGRKGNKRLAHNEIKGYVIKYGSSQNNLNQEKFIPVGNRNTTIEGLPFGTQFWFAIATEATENEGIVYVEGTTPTTVGDFSPLVTVAKPPAPTGFRIITFLRDYLDQDNEEINQYMDKAQREALQSMSVRKIYDTLNEKPKDPITKTLSLILEKEFHKYTPYYTLDEIKTMLLIELYNYEHNSDYFAFHTERDEEVKI